MTDIDVTPLDEDAYGVRVREGDNETNHRVTIPEWMLEEPGIGDFDPEEVVRESFAYLLEREPATSILGDFPLDAITSYFPDYVEELKTRLATG